MGRMVEQEHSGGRDVAPIGAGVQVSRAVLVGLHMDVPGVPDTKIGLNVYRKKTARH
ncbi:MAG: hypothetical protein Q8R78_00640 [Candidatus Omnitrophota bacterium]|nr:hypothetical protein [Candidatus Omnitrophota bacterium]